MYFHFLFQYAGFLNPLHKDVKSKIQELVVQGVRNVEEMKVVIMMVFSYSVTLPLW